MAKYLARSVSHEKLSAIWHVLRLLLVDSEVSSDLLISAFNDLERENNKNTSLEFVEFAPFLLEKITKGELWDVVSESLIKQLQAYSRTAAAKAAIREQVLGKIGERLSNNAIQAVLLKGAALHGYIYPKTSFRLGFDVDLLIRADDYDRIGNVLGGLATEVKKFSDDSEIKTLSVERSFVSVNPPLVSLDIHRELTNPYIYSIDYNELFNRSLVYPANEKQFRLLSPEDNLVHFAIHAFYDLKLLSKQTLDTFVLIKSVPIDWVLLVNLAKQYRVQLPLMYLLQGLNYAFGYNPPQYVQREIVVGRLRYWLSHKVLIDQSAKNRNCYWGFRLKQLISHWFLSGNIKGVFRYQMSYVKARLIDFVRTFIGKKKI
jgi:hypothetical protein